MEKENDTKVEKSQDSAENVDFQKVNNPDENFEPTTEDKLKDNRISC